MNDHQQAAPEQPPHSIDAEQSVLGALLLDNGSWREIRGALDGGDFYSEAHRLIFEHAESRLREGEPIDVTLLADSLHGSGKLDYIGGLAYLGALVENVPTAKNIAHYAAIVRDRADLRRIAGIAQEIHASAMRPNGHAASDVLQQAKAKLRLSGASGWRYPEPVSEAEWTSARITPECIVEAYLFADVAALVAGGGIGKTTIVLFEAAHIVLGLPLYGLAIRKPGKVLILTAEDPREILVARLREICKALNLSESQTETVRRDVRISDLCGTGFRLTCIADDLVVTSPAVDHVIEECEQHRPVLVSIDPMVSFGVGESRVNDAEQGLIEAGRKIRRAIGCCVRFTQHSGKQSYRDEVVDQYAGRGGSTMSDGSRMVAVMQPLGSDKWLTATGARLLDGEQGILLARPKLSFAPPQPDILICRKGYSFQHSSRFTPTKAERLAGDCEQILARINADLDAGRQPTQNSLQALRLDGMSRADVRDAVETLLSQRRIEYAEILPRPARGVRVYLRPVAAPAEPTGRGAPSLE